MVMEILGYACVALVCMKVGAFLERLRTGRRCANTSTNSQRDEILLCGSMMSCDCKGQGNVCKQVWPCNYQRKTSPV